MAAHRFPKGTPFHERLVPRLVVPVLGPCLEWQGAGNPEGYGHFRENYKLVYAHRRAWELANGPVPAGLMVLHTCDNPPCCEPTHLFLGTDADNMADMAAKGRATTWQRGESHPQHKLTDAQIAAMRSQRRGGALLSTLAVRFGCDESWASRLCRKEVRP